MVGDFFMDWLTEYRILRVPIMNWAIMIFYGAFLLRLSLKFKSLYDRHALTTMMVTNILLYGLADTIAQTIGSVAAFKPQPEENASLIFVRYILERGRPRRVILDEADDDLVELGLDDPFMEVNQADFHTHHHPPHNREVFHFRRLALFTLWGIIISFFQSPWYAFLNSAYSNDNKFLSVLKRVLTDQLCFSPISLACLLSYMAYAIEQGGQQGVANKLRTKYLPTLGINWVVWPATQFFNFLVMPSPLQIPFSSTIGVFWNAYLSYRNASDAK
jgi:protein Mpv17